MEITAQQLASLVGGTVDGNANVVINNYAKIEEATAGCLTFLANPKYTHFIYTTHASAVLVREDFVPEQPVTATLIRVADPYATLAQLLNFVQSQMPVKSGIEQPAFIAQGVEVPEGAYVGAFAYVGQGVKLGKNVKIYPQVYVGDGVTLGDDVILYPGVKIYHGCKIGNRCIVHAGAVIGGDGFGFAPQPDGHYEKISQIGIVVLEDDVVIGDGSTIYPNVTIYDGCRIGQRVTIHAGAVIGADGFGFAPTEQGYQKIPQLGIVVIEDDVEIGANTTIDRATMGATVVRRGVKLDNLIQVAHNVEIGEHTVMAAQVGIAGSTKIGRFNTIGGQVGFAGHITVGDHNGIGAQSGVPNSVGDNQRLLGSPAINALDFARQNVYFKRLAQMAKDIKTLQKELDALKQQ